MPMRGGRSSRSQHPLRRVVNWMKEAGRRLKKDLRQMASCCVAPEPTDGYSDFVISGVASLPQARRDKRTSTVGSRSEAAASSLLSGRQSRLATEGSLYDDASERHSVQRATPENRWSREGRLERYASADFGGFKHFDRPSVDQKQQVLERPEGRQGGGTAIIRIGHRFSTPGNTDDVDGRRPSGGLHEPQGKPRASVLRGRGQSVDHFAGPGQKHSSFVNQVVGSGLHMVDLSTPLPPPPGWRHQQPTSKN